MPRHVYRFASRAKCRVSIIAGIEPGDRVLEINSVAMRYWEDIEQVVESSPGKELQLRISRNDGGIH